MHWQLRLAADRVDANRDDRRRGWNVPVHGGVNKSRNTRAAIETQSVSLLVTDVYAAHQWTGRPVMCGVPGARPLKRSKFFLSSRLVIVRPFTPTYIRIYPTN
jgi:hypothetical protein